MPQQTSTFEACSWVPILQVGGLGKVRVNCFPKAIATWHDRETNPRPPDLEPDALTTPHDEAHSGGNPRWLMAVKTLAQRSEDTGLIPGRVKPRTLKLVLVADPPGVWHYGFSAKSGRPGVRIM
ncbi:hypothetical protein ElyMa_001536900 [Elysia marginata]|uniref:Uncharacterized protein n=1 Tax=Elysia marginata TaxID=1093978 RepID=A0AAV4JCF7_9GAST|nr:hypothetical protein ElyMa_001536900 [Elysia marginata]